MKRIINIKSIVSLLLILVIAAGFALPAGAYSSQSSKLFSLFAKEGGSLQGYLDNVLIAEAGSSYGDWQFIDLMRHDSSLNGEKYIAKLDAFIAGSGPTNNTEKVRVAIAYTAAGVKNDFVNDAIELDFTETGINGVIFGLILLDCGGYESAKNDRDALIGNILQSQLSDNGWALFGSVSDVDVTSMALQALAPYKSRSGVSAAIDRALTMLSEKQTSDGDFKSMMGMGRPPAPTCESTAQVIIALTSLGINPATDARFIKNGHTTYDGLRRYQLDDGAYCHSPGGSRNAIATEQASRALVAAERFASGKPSYFSFEKHSVTPAEPPVVTPEKPDESVSSPAEADKESSSSDDLSGSSEEPSDSSSEPEESLHSGSSAEASSETLPEESGSEGVAASSGKNTYKYYVSAAIVLLFLGACGFLIYKKRANLKNIIPLLLVAALLICGVVFVNFTSVKDYYSVNLGSASEGDDTVTISISCNNLKGVADDVPEDGYILKPTQYVIKEGDTVFDALLAVTRANHIKITYTGSPGGVLSIYVSSIGGYSEMQYGALSGWIYRVNDYTPDVGCGSYDIKNGDVIKWVYTLDLGKDAENE